MADHRFTVYRIGVYPRDDLTAEGAELARVGVREVVIERPETEDAFIECTRDADGLIILGGPVSRRVLEALKRCKVLLRAGVGVDEIDVGAATELGIAVVNVPDLWAREVANHALALLLACNRKLLGLDRAVRKGQWPLVIPPPVGSLHGESLGLVGVGGIGRLMARRASALEMHSLAYDPYAPPAAFEDVGAVSVSFDELLQRSDYVSIHCPKTEETTHLFNEDAFQKMKPTAYLINTSRGAIVEQEALVLALKEGWIAGAGLDVQELEPPALDSPLMQMDNVILTPHAGYYSDPAIRALPLRCGQEVARVLSGRLPMNLVNPRVLDRLPLSQD